METGMKKLEVHQESCHIPTAFSDRNHPQNILISNAVPPDPTKSHLKNKSNFVLPADHPLLPPVSRDPDWKRPLLSQTFPSIVPWFWVAPPSKSNDDFLNVTPETFQFSPKPIISCSLHGDPK
jgi:hypothetical protein